MLQRNAAVHVYTIPLYSAVKTQYSKEDPVTTPLILTPSIT
jgi:hypothetical protein